MPRQGDLIGSNSPATASNSPITTRLINASVDIQTSPVRELAFQHTVFCQTAMPYRNPGDHLRHWERTNGQITLEIEAGRALDPRTRKFGPVPLPYGPRARLVLMHLHTIALRTGEPVIEVEDSLTAFVRRIIRRAPRGQDIKSVRDQLTALAAALVRLGMTRGDRAFQIDSKVIEAFDLWAPDNPQQRILWPSTVRLSDPYFRSLVEHAVPLDERAVAGLAHSARALDVYTWLAQRLHRIAPGRPQFVAWPILQEQFGFDYHRIRDFRRQFLYTLGQVGSQYPTARVEADRRGMTLRYSPPPINRRHAHLVGP